MTITNTLRTIDSKNVVAKLEGSDPTLKDEYVVYTAHWDHLGTGPPTAIIFNGAKDNALGCAALLEMARAFTKLPAPPKRSILFLAVTAEEQGLLGSQYYAVTPIYPLAKTLANINMDSLNVHGRTKDLTLDRLRRVRPRRLRARRGRRAGPRRPRRRRAGEGLLLPVGSLQLREAGRAGAQPRRGRRLHRQAAGLRQTGAAGDWNEQRLPHSRSTS